MTGRSEGGLAKGQRFDRYEIRAQIGQGGMGAVYRAFDSKLGRTVALKTVVAQHAGAQMTEVVRQRFLREALAISKIDHRNVVQVLDFGFADDGTPFLVMEYLRGRDLASLVKASTDPLAIGFVADIALGVCAALRACHHADIVHRDLKPSNVFLIDTDTGFEVKVLDFGVSKAAMVADADITEDGQIVGTPQYISPEQVNGRVGPESDQYALGVLLYVCLTKRLPFRDHQGVTLLRAIEAGRFEPPRTHRPDLPPELEAIILRAMAHAPGDRFDAIHSLGQKLWEFASQRGRDQWKNFYFHTPPMAHPTKDSMPGMPLLEVLALGGAARRDEPRAAPPVAKSATPPTALAVPMSETSVEPPAKPKPQEAPVGTPKRQVLISTKLAAPVTTGELEAALGRSRRRRAIIATVAGTIALAAGIGALRLWARSPETTASVIMPAAPIAAAAAPSSPRLTRPTTAGPAAAPAKRPPATGETAGQPSPPPAPGRAGSTVPVAKTHATHQRGLPTIDQNGIGIPAN